MKRIVFLMGILSLLSFVGCIEQDPPEFKGFCQSDFACGSNQYYNAVSSGNNTDKEITCVCKISETYYLRMDYTIHKDSISGIGKT
jgi:hypothetical protein